MHEKIWGVIDRFMSWCILDKSNKKLQACKELREVSLASGSFVTPEVVLSGPDVRVETRDAEKETELWEVGSPPFNRGNITRPSAGFHSPAQACRCSKQEPSSVHVQLGLAELQGQTAAVPNLWGRHYVLPAHAARSLCVGGRSSLPAVT